jgi:ATP-dependent protease La (LON) substrate-binding domain
MLRRCLESPNPRFGVMPPSTTANLSHVGGYGTMVTIQRVRMHSDGRSFLQTIGAQRFRILEQGTLDGYTVARVEMCVLQINCLLSLIPTVIGLKTFRTNPMTGQTCRPHQALPPGSFPHPHCQSVLLMLNSTRYVANSLFKCNKRLGLDSV